MIIDEDIVAGGVTPFIITKLIERHERERQRYRLLHDYYMGDHRILSRRKRGKNVFYAYLRGLVVFLLWIINGNAHYHNRDKLLNKDENYILVAPHRTWWDPVYMAFSARPKQFIFMAKK